jgi:chitin disaccharide deacetylase
MRIFTSRSIIYSAVIITIFTGLLHAQQKRTVAERLGYPANSRLLLIHADDFGMLHSVNQATSEALEKHWITSASILVPCPWFPEAAAFAKSHPNADLGIHVALNSEWTTVRWRPVSPQPANSSLLDSDGYLPLEETAVAAHAKPDDVAAEVRAQLQKAKQAGVNITHLDAHMKAIIGTPELMKVYLQAASDSHVPALVADRPAQPAAPLPVFASLIDGEVQMHPGVPRDQWLNWYKTELSKLPPGVYQLTVHLGFDDNELRGATADHPDWGAAWRQSDYDLVRNPEFQQFLRDQKFVLVSWRDLAHALQD